MNAALPNSPFLSPAATPLGSPLLPTSDGMEQGYIPPPIDDFFNDYDEFDDYGGGGGFGQYGEGFGGYGGYEGYGGYGRAMGGMGARGAGGMGGMGAGDLNFRGLKAETFPNYQSEGMGGFGSGGLGYGNGMFEPGLGNNTGLVNASPGGYGGSALSAVGPSNITYDPVFGPGIQGTYYPKMAAMQRGTYGYPGAAVGLPPPPVYNSSGSRRGLRRSRSFF